MVNKLCSRMDLTSIKVSQQCPVTHSLEMDDNLGTPSLRPHIKKFLEGIHLWTWYELLEALKQCQDLFPSKSNTEEIIDRIVENLIERLASPSITSPYTCSSNRSSFQFSCDTSSNKSWKYDFFSGEATWWFEHLMFLKINLLDKVIRTMISYDFDHGIVSKFLFHYNTSSFLGAEQTEKIKATKAVINLLSLLDMRSISCKNLFNLNRIAISLKIKRFFRSKIESLIGPLLDQVTIDYLLVPSPQGRDHAYDVGFVLRLMHAFLLGGSFELTLNQIKRVVKMMDLFLVEVAPDPHLKPSEFEALITVLPDTAREAHDHLYLAMDMYLKVHAGLGEKEKMSICYRLNHEKLSPELLRHLTRSLVFPSGKKPKTHVTRQSRMKTLLRENDHLQSFFDSMFRKSFKNINIDVKEDVEKKNYDAELSSTAIQKSGIHIMNNAIYLPKFCS